MYSRRIGSVTLALTLLLGMVSAFPSVSLANPVARKVHKAEAKSFLETFDQIHQKIRGSFYDKYLHGLNWGEVGAKYRAKVHNDMTRREFVRVVNAMIDELHASHCELISDDDFGYYLLPCVLNQDLEGRKATHIGVTGRYEGNDYIVTGVLESSPAAKAGLIAGDRILSVEGSPFTTIGSFRDREGKPTNLTVNRNGEAKPITLEVTPRKENLLRAFLEATRHSAKPLR